MPFDSSPPLLPPAPGTPDGPAGYDPGVTPGDPTGGFLDWLSRVFGPQAPIPVYPPGDRRNDMVIGPDVPSLDPEPAIQDTLKRLEEGLPIFGTFALLAAVFLIGLWMFLSESGAAAPLKRGAALALK